MKYIIVLIFLGIVIESMFVAGQQSRNDDEYEIQSSAELKENNGSAGNRRPTDNFNGKYKKVLKVKKDNNQEPLPVVGRRISRPKTSNSESDSVPDSSNKNSFTVNSYDDNDDSYSRRRSRFLFRQRVGK